MKRVFALILALAMILSMGITAFAEEGKGSIEITNATPGETYTIYKIFDARPAEDGSAIDYLLEPKSSKQAEAVFNELFEPVEDDKGSIIGYTNDFFNYNINTAQVTKKDNVNDSELIDYLAKGVKGMTYNNGSKKAESSSLKFAGLDYGYYVVTSSVGTAVSITSTNPTATIIDKNQTPFKTFEKSVANYDADGELLTYGKGNIMAIGETMNYMVKFETTNYFGDEKVKYYRVYDNYGDAIWIDVDSFVVTVKAPDKDAVTLTKGYYLNGAEQTKIGTWNGVLNDAEWYVVNMGNESFRITIPWLTNHQVHKNEDDTYRLDTPETESSKFDTRSMVTITYDAVLKTNAYIGGDYHAEMINEAYGAVVTQKTTNSTTKDTVLTETFGLGILKDDLATKQNLAGAEFRLYSDENLSKRVFVVPTDIDGIYMVNTTAKEDRYPDLMPSEVYPPAADSEYADGDNLVVSQANGKLMVLGLPAGTYYLVETKAPATYNSLTQPVVMTVNSSNKSPFTVYANAAGEVIDTQQPVANYREVTHRVYHQTVHNSQGTVLPSTGGEGTILLITIGTIVAMAFAVLMITQKKMSIYKD